MWFEVRVECASRNAPGLVSHFFFPRTLQIQDKRQPLPNLDAAAATSGVRGDLRKEAGGANPATGRPGDLGTFHSSSHPEAAPSFGCARLALAVGGPSGSGDYVASQRVAGIPGPVGAHC